MNTTSPIDWNELAQSIAEGEAVLVLGPDAIPLYRIGPTPDNDPDEPAEMTFSQLTRRRIRRSRDTGVTYFYERDNLFLFRDEAAKDNARKIVKKCADNKNWLPDEEMLRNLLAMKFPLVLSLSPDSYVREAFTKYGLPHQFDYFTANIKTVEAVLSVPKISQPILYNLCGAVKEDYDSIVLDYYDLFILLAELLKDHDERPPNVLKTTLQKANRYVLFGFDLERWYSQLFLQYVNKLKNEWDNKNHNFALFTKISEDSREFVIRQFQVKCIAPSREEFDCLIEACIRANALRPLPNPLAGPATEIRIAIERDDLPAALALLEKHATVIGNENIVPILKGQYSEWHKAITEKTEDLRDLQLMKNKIRSRILTFSAQLT